MAGKCSEIINDILMLFVHVLGVTCDMRWRAHKNKKVFGKTR